MESNGFSTPEIVTAILCNEDVSGAVKRLIRAKQAELKQYEDDLEREEAFAELLIKSKRMPESSAGRRIADGICQELRKAFPDAAAEADRRIKARKEAEQAELDRICAQRCGAAPN